MKIVFLDRDGVINQYPGHGFYVTKVKDFHFLPGALEAISDLTQKGYKIFVISNQAGVGRGVFTLDKLKQIDAHMHKGVNKAGGKIQGSFYCIHHPDDGCDCRKPAIGSIKRALKSINKTIKAAKGVFFVGDMQGDIQTGYNAGCRTIFSLSGGEKNLKTSGWPVQPDFIVKDLKEAVEVITQHENSSHSRNRRRRT